MNMKQNTTAFLLLFQDLPQTSYLSIKDMNQGLHPHNINLLHIKINILLSLLFYIQYSGHEKEF
jgi:hypothetical protein